MDGYTDLIRVDALDLRPGDMLVSPACGMDYYTGVLDIACSPITSVREAFNPYEVRVHYEDRTVGSVPVEVVNGHPRRTVWARLKLDQPTVVNNSTYVEAPRTYELISGHEAEYRTVHDAGIFRFDYVPEGWELRGNADEPFEAKADASDDDYDPGHIVEARPPRPPSAAEGRVFTERLIEQMVEGVDGFPLIRWPVGVCFIKPRDAAGGSEDSAEKGDDCEAKDAADPADPTDRLHRLLAELEKADPSVWGRRTVKLPVEHNGEPCLPCSSSRALVRARDAIDLLDTILNGYVEAQGDLEVECAELRERLEAAPAPDADDVVHGPDDIATCGYCEAQRPEAVPGIRTVTYAGVKGDMIRSGPVLLPTPPAPRRRRWMWK